MAQSTFEAFLKAIHLRFKLGIPRRNLGVLNNPT